MNVIPTALSGVLIIEPKVFSDSRGYFYESFNHQRFEEALGYPVNFVQDNHSYSKQGVLRGLHYQKPPTTQAKLVRVVQGEVYDVAVDIRQGSETFGQYVGAVLSAENHKQLWVPEGFLHGFVVLSAEASFLYKTTNYYSAADELCVCWDDEEIAIDWPLPTGFTREQLIVSDKDRAGLSLSSLVKEFV